MAWRSLPGGPLHPYARHSVLVRLLDPRKAPIREESFHHTAQKLAGINHRNVSSLRDFGVRTASPISSWRIRTASRWMRLLSLGRSFPTA